MGESTVILPKFRWNPDRGFEKRRLRLAIPNVAAAVGVNVFVDNGVDFAAMATSGTVVVVVRHVGLTHDNSFDNVWLRVNDFTFARCCVVTSTVFEMTER